MTHTHWISALSFALTAVAVAGCSGGSSSKSAQVSPAATASTPSGVRASSSEGEEGFGEVFGDEFNAAYVQLEAVRQPHALPETFYETEQGAPLADLAREQTAHYVALGTSGTGYTMVGRDGALLQYGTPELVTAIRVAGRDWAEIYPELPMHLRSLSPQDMTQHFVGNLYACVETYGLGHILGRRKETYADEGAEVEWVTRRDSDNNGVVWHHMGKEADFQEFKSGAMNEQLVTHVETAYGGTQRSRVYIFDVLSESNDVILNGDDPDDPNAPNEIASPLHIDFHGDTDDFKRDPLYDDYNDFRKQLYYQQVRDCKAAKAAGQ